ncbi:hypothetical protein PV08_09338 [Exophiala spinifera]|uniref:Hyphally-regulated cell wall protein N-terminal domain-containing protein n=1 Tax=Exophiala spinifera TaxID=91928 RepID=A0A0D2BLM0_9EURO|nr:uncharacterized protein PV08_09338 [Exophiala spinifera]KIW12064.1 hypothetical protein PV08_09338 [Exophiala spinifera]
MCRFWYFVALYVAVVHAEDLRRNARTPLKFMPKRAVDYTNSTTRPTAMTTSPSETLSLPPYSDDTITHPITSTAPTNIGIYTNTSSILPETTTTTDDDTPTCAGSITYYGSVPPTVYITVTEGFNVTVTASNISITDTPTLITPLPYCKQTIMPKASQGVPVPGSPFFSASAAASPALSFSKSAGSSPFATQNPKPPSPQQTEETATQAASSVYSSVPYTSTVIVTKKTPVPVIAPPTTSPDINFDPTPPSSKPTSESSSINTITGGDNGDGTPGNNGHDGGPDHNGGGLSPGGSGTSSTTKPPAEAFPSLTNTAGTAAGTLVVPSTTRTGIGNIIYSIIYSPFATRTPTGLPAFLPTTTTVDNIPIVVSESRVIIGTQTVNVPRSSSIVVQAGGEAFTVRPSIIVAPTATITIAPVPQNNAATVSPATTTFTTAVGDLTITVGPTVAIISGTTYRIGPNAPATTISVHGTKVSIGSEGIGLPRTTIFPGGSRFMVVTAEGLTFSLDESDAVFSGTTYRIGSNAPQVTRTVASDSVSFGPGGIGLKSTTILPSAAPHSTQQTSEPSATSASSASASESAGTESAASSRFKSLHVIFGWYALALFLCLIV